MTARGLLASSFLASLSLLALTATACGGNPDDMTGEGAGGVESKATDLIVKPPILPRPHPLPHPSYRPLFSANMTGTEIDLPLGVVPTSGVGSLVNLIPCNPPPYPNYMPCGYISVYPAGSSPMSWDFGVQVDNVDNLYQHAFNLYAVPNDTFYSNPVGADQPLLEVTGLFNNNGPGIVRGTVAYDTPQNSFCGTPLVLALQSQDDANVWHDLLTIPVAAASDPSLTSRQPWGTALALPEASLSASVDPNTPVRVQLRSSSNACGGTVKVHVWSASLFGQQCFPDASNPGSCL